MLTKSELEVYKSIFEAEPDVQFIELKTFRKTNSNSPYCTTIFYKTIDAETGIEIIRCKCKSSIIPAHVLPFLSYIDRNMVVHNITTTRRMFDSCTHILEITSGQWNLSLVTDMAYMFKDCVALTNIPMRDWKMNFSGTNRLISTIKGMFEGCVSLKFVDLISFSNISITDASDLFKGCVNITYINIRNWDFNNANISNMFYQTFNLKHVYGIETWNIKSDSNIIVDNMLYNSKLKEPDWYKNLINERSKAKPTILTPQQLIKLPSIEQMQSKFPGMPSIEQVQKRMQELSVIV